MAENMAVAGQISPVLSTLALNSEKLRSIWTALMTAVDLGEFAFLAFAGWGMVPLAAVLRAGAEKLRPTIDHAAWEYKRARAAMKDEEWDGDEEWTDSREREEAAALAAAEDDGDESSSGALVTVRRQEFEDTYTYHALKRISQAAKIGAAIYTVDCVAVMLNAMGFQYRQQAGFSQKAGKITVTVWAATQLSRFKRFLIDRWMENQKIRQAKRVSKLGPGANPMDTTFEPVHAKLLDRALSAVLWVVTAGHVLDMLNIDVGTSVKSLLAFGGVGTVIVSLATKDLATQVVSGMVLSTSDRFYEGDEIELGDGTHGIIQSMGLMHTDLRGGDEIITRIPNTQIATQRARNISRVHKSQVKQTLWFGYKDVMKMEDVVREIKEEIRSTCGSDLILDGTRPFRVNWRDFKEDHLEVVVDCHFNMKPVGDKYLENRQRVLEAIARAVDRLNVEFTLPSQICHKEGSKSWV